MSGPFFVPMSIMPDLFLYLLPDNAWLYWSLVAAYFLTVLSIVGLILSENRNPVKSLAWVTVLLLFPVGGIILYIFFGRSIKNQHMISRRNKRRLRQSQPQVTPFPSLTHLTPESRQQVQLARSLTGSRYFTGNDITIFTSGEEKFDSLFKDIRNATRSINLQYYIIEDDTIGHQLFDLLVEKASQGIKVRVIYDHIGSIHVKNRFFKAMRKAGIEVYPFFKVAFPIFATRINWRNHRKIVIIDGKIGYMGGMNVADRYITGGNFKKWHDTHVRISGPAVAALQSSFAIDWNFMGQPLIEEEISAQESTDRNAAGMQLLTSGPTSQWSNIEYLLVKAIGNAKKRIYIQTPYFLPPEGLLRALQTAALARVDVRIMMPVRSDSRILTYASYSYIEECLKAGIKIYLYEGGMLHSKTVVVDDEFSSIGSSNIDFRSFEHNFESNLFVYSRSVNQQMCKLFEDDEKESTRLKIGPWRRRPRGQKILESLYRLLSPIL